MACQPVRVDARSGYDSLHVALSLSIYYGWPSLVNSAFGDVDAAAAEFAKFDAVVFGATLEEVTHLDHDNTAEIIRQLKERHLGILITDHSVRETLDVTDRAYILHDGQVLMEGRPEEIVANSEVRRVYLGDRFSL